MREYIIVIASAAILSVFADMLSPEQWRKYVKIVTGFVIISVIIAPIAKIKNMDLLSEMDFENSVTINEADYSNRWVIDEFERLVEEDIRDRIKNEYGKESSVRVTVRVNNEDKIEKIENVRIDVDSPPTALAGAIAQMYGIDISEVTVNG